MSETKRHPRKRSSFYHLRKKIIANTKATADLLDVSVETVEQWDLEGAPKHVESYLLLWDKKYVGYDGWKGFYFSRGILRYKNHRWTPNGLLHDIFLINEISRLEREICRLERESIFKVIQRKLVSKLLTLKKAWRCRHLAYNPVIYGKKRKIHFL